MARPYAVSLGAIALGIIAVRGAISGDLASSALVQGLIGMVVFGGIGYFIGAIADYLVRQAVELRFRERVAEVMDHIERMEIERENSDVETHPGQE